MALCVCDVNHDEEISGGFGVELRLVGKEDRILFDTFYTDRGRPAAVDRELCLTITTPNTASAACIYTDICTYML